MHVNFYAGGTLDRTAPLRRDDAHFQALLAEPVTRVVAVWRDRNLIRTDPEPAAIWLTEPAAVAEAVSAARTVALLGRGDGCPYVAVDLSELDDPTVLAGIDRAEDFIGLRDVSAAMNREEAALLAYAKGLMFWHGRHLFCGACGAPTHVEASGHVRRCTNPDCAVQHFPRTDPAVIMLVVQGDRCLLGRNRRFPFKLYSALAGFVEPGESLEEAVIREVLEEAGVHVGGVRYHSSQPWPFPGSIMLGFHAEGISEEIVIEDDELLDAQWFTRDQLSRIDGQDMRLPRSDAIARQLVDAWLRGDVAF